MSSLSRRGASTEAGVLVYPLWTGGSGVVPCGDWCCGAGCLIFLLYDVLGGGDLGLAVAAG